MSERERERERKRERDTIQTKLSRMKATLIIRYNIYIVCTAALLQSVMVVNMCIRLLLGLELYDMEGVSNSDQGLDENVQF